LIHITGNNNCAVYGYEVSWCVQVWNLIRT
jgi:hypothetical protein